MRLSARRYLVRGPDGKELVCPSLSDLHALYAQGFLADDDQVKREGAGPWTPAGQFPALHGARQVRRDPRRVLAILIAAAVLSLAVALLLRR